LPSKFGMTPAKNAFLASPSALGLTTTKPVQRRPMFRRREYELHQIPLCCRNTFLSMSQFSQTSNKFSGRGGLSSRRQQAIEWTARMADPAPTRRGVLLRRCCDWRGRIRRCARGPNWPSSRRLKPRWTLCETCCRRRRSPRRVPAGVGGQLDQARRPCAGSGLSEG
jgi:hypothetical protein